MSKKMRRANARLPHWPSQHCFSEDVVGESFYRESFEHILTPAKGEIVIFGIAELCPQPNNVHDKNAVAVLYEGRQIGYLSRDSAEKYQASVVMNADVYEPPNTTAYAQIKRILLSSGEEVFSVRLDMSFSVPPSDVEKAPACRTYPYPLPILDRIAVVSDGYLIFINSDLNPQVVAGCTPGALIDCWSPESSEDIHLFLPGTIGGSGRFAVTDRATLKRAGFDNPDDFAPVIRSASGNVVIACAKLPR